MLLCADRNSAAIAVALEIDCDFSRLTQIEILEADRAARAEVGNILVRAFLAVTSFLGDERIGPWDT